MRKIVVVVLLVVAFAVGVAVWMMRGKVVLSSAEVERKAAQMLPGAAPPAGLKGVLGLHPEDLEVAILAPSLDKADAGSLTGSDLRIIIARPDRQQDKQPSPDEIRAKIDRARARKAEEMDTLSKEPARLRVGGKPYPGMKSSLVVKSNGVRLTEYLAVFVKDSGPVIVLIAGPEASFNQAAMAQFLAGLQPGTSPLDGLPSGLPAPAEGPPGAGRPRPPLPREGPLPGPPGGPRLPGR